MYDVLALFFVRGLVIICNFYYFYLNILLLMIMIYHYNDNHHVLTALHVCVASDLVFLLG